jgi:serine protease Do
MSLLLAAVTAVAAFLAGPIARAAQPEACDAETVASNALSAIVNITDVRAVSKDSPIPGEPPSAHFETFVGSGVVIDPSGIIVTNKHVIQDAAIIRVTFNDRLRVSAQLVAAATYSDIAVLKVNLPNPLPTLSFANSDAAKIGQPVVAIGNPLGLGTSVSTGVISGLNRDLMRSPFDDYIQTDAAINPGNSGGPLLDCSGNVIGINTALLSNSAKLGSIGLGFSIPANITRYIVGRLEDPSKAMPNWVGVHLQDLTAPLAIAFGLPVSSGGAIVTDADPDSPAGRASLQPGDVILTALGRPMLDARAILRAVIMAPDGVAIPMTIWRDGHRQDVTLQSRPWPRMLALRSQVLASPANIAKAEAAGLGLHVASVTAADRQRYHLEGSAGVLIDQVTPDSQAASLGLKPGDVIEQVGRQPATSPAQVTAQFELGKTAPGNVIAVLVRDQSGLQWHTLWAGTIDPSELVAGPLEQPREGGQVHDVAGRPR